MRLVLLLASGLSTGHKAGLIVMAAVFIVFSLVSAMVVPRRHGNFPGRGASVYYLATGVLFVLMIGAVVIFGAESPDTGSRLTAAKSGIQRGTIDVTEAEWRVTLPPSTTKTMSAGVYTFHVVNQGKIPHNLTIDGPRLSGVHTPNIAPGGTADLKVALVAGRYDLFCSIPGHKQLGMDAKLSVG